jgi:molybdenum cofactor cytidylyltransferase
VKSGVVTVVLAAGAGNRLGGPKALMLWPAAGGDRPLAIAHVEERLAAESERVLVVIRKPLFVPLLPFLHPGVDFLVSDAPDDLGPAGSLAAAVPKLGDAALVLVTPVDTVPARADTVARLVDRLRHDASVVAARPVYQGRPGHPVLLRRATLDRYTQPSPPPLRDHLRGLGAACAGVEVADPAVLIDLNTPADVMGAIKRPPRFPGA